MARADRAAGRHDRRMLSGSRLLMNRSDASGLEGAVKSQMLSGIGHKMETSQSNPSAPPSPHL